MKRPRAARTESRLIRILVRDARTGRSRAFSVHGGSVMTILRELIEHQHARRTLTVRGRVVLPERGAIMGTE